MRILAIDPATSTGYAFSSFKDRIEHSGTWNLGADAQARLTHLADHIRRAHRDWQPEILAYELAGYGSHNMHAKGRHNEMAGVITLIAAELGIPSWGFLPNTWKARAVGKGNAGKQAVMNGLVAYFGIAATSNDEADAIGVLLCAQQGPPPETKRKRAAKERQRAKSIPRLFR